MPLGEPIDKERAKHSGRLYAVMTDSHAPFDKTILARIKPPLASRRRGFWTDTAEDEVWLMSRQDAEEILANLYHNSPRIVGSEKALKIIRRQCEEKKLKLNLAVESMTVEHVEDALPVGPEF